MLFKFLDDFSEIQKILKDKIIQKCAKEYPLALSCSQIAKYKESIIEEIYKNSRCKERATDSLGMNLILEIEHFKKKFSQRIFGLSSKNDKEDNEEHKNDEEHRKYSERYQRRIRENSKNSER